MKKLDPSDHWTVPYVTGHKYRIKLGNDNSNFDSINYQLSERWEENDKSVYFVNGFTDQREEVILTVNNQKVYGNDTIPLLEADYRTS